MSSISEHLNKIRAQSENAAKKSERTASDIILIAVTKTYSTDMINEAIDNGVTDIGENKVQEMLESLNIPVFIDCSSNESHPLGRTEWIRLYGVLTGKEKEAEAFFQSQVNLIENAQDMQSSGKRVAFFYLHTDGTAVIRSTTDYIPAIIRLAGGEYAFDGLADANSSKSSPSISLENLYVS